MAASELIGKALLSASLELLFDRMASKQVVDFVRGNKLLDDGLLKLKMMLLLSVNNGVLNEAEKKQISDPSVRKWLDELKHSIYNAEDLVYQIYTESLRCEIEAACRSKSFKLQVLNFFSSRFSVKNVEIEKIEHEMVDIIGSLEYIVKKKGLLGLELEGGGVIENKSSPRPLEGGDYPQKLSDEESWQLFAKNVFNNHVEQSAGYPALEVIGKRIVKRCKGVPLAVKLVAGVLRSERNPEKWDEILKDEIWELVDHEKETDIPPALWLSYYYLPPHLKRCFAYCSIFPKGYEFEKQDLIWLWMAEDLLQPQKTKIPEEVGEDYFNDLTSRLLFHCSNIYNFYTMHDLVNDLASFVSGEFCMRLDDNDTKLVTSNVRHLSCLIQNHYISKLEASNEKTLLRTLLPTKWSIEQTIDLELLQRMQCLRVLRTGRISISELPSSIGNLKLLRYLDLSMSEFEVLPDTIGNLYNLQTLLLGSCMRLYWLPDSISNLKHLRHLDLSWNILLLYLPDTVCDLHNLHTLSLNNCRALCRLPTDMAKLINLRHLDIICTHIREMPPQMSDLRYLQTLSSFFVCKNSSGSSIKELGKLDDLRGNLWIRKLENVENVDDVTEAKLKNKMCITELCLWWELDDAAADDSEKAEQVLERLEPHTNLEELSIRNYGGKCFPNWVGHGSFHHMVTMSLRNCKNCRRLPPLGQLPSLKKLHVEGFDMVEKVGEEFYYSSGSSSSSSSYSSSTNYKPFKSLEILNFTNMPKWKEWSFLMVRGGDQEDVGAFLQLKELELRNCPKLTAAGMPRHLSSLKTCLSICRCQNFVAFTPN